MYVQHVPYRSSQNAVEDAPVINTSTRVVSITKIQKLIIANYFMVHNLFGVLVLKTLPLSELDLDRLIRLTA